MNEKSMLWMYAGKRSKGPLPCTPKALFMTPYGRPLVLARFGDGVEAWVSVFDLRLVGGDFYGFMHMLSHVKGWKKEIGDQMWSMVHRAREKRVAADQVKALRTDLPVRGAGAGGGDWHGQGGSRVGGSAR